MNIWLKLTMDNFVYVFDAWRKWSCAVVCVWPRTNSDTIFIWNDKVKATVLVSVRIFVDKISTYYLKRWIYGPCACAKLSVVSPFLRVLNIQWWHLIYIYSYIYFIALVKSVQTSHQPTFAQSEKTTWRLEIILRMILIKKWARNIPQ